MLGFVVQWGVPPIRRGGCSLASEQAVNGQVLAMDAMTHGDARRTLT